MAKKDKRKDEKPKAHKPAKGKKEDKPKGGDVVAGDSQKDAVSVAAQPTAPPSSARKRKEPNEVAVKQAAAVLEKVDEKFGDIEALIAGAFTDKVRSPRWALKRLKTARVEIKRHLDRCAVRA